jgi:hypothetical protein
VNAHFHADAADLLKTGLRRVGDAVAEVDVEIELHIGSIA